MPHGRSKRPGRPQGANPKEQKPEDVTQTISNEAEQTAIQAVIQADSAPAEKKIAEQPTRATADCESAKEESCSCRCRGKYHGKPHPKGWKDEEGCGPLNIQERKDAKKAALYAWRKAHPERVSTYMKAWRTERKEKEAVAKEASIDEAAEEAEGEDGAEG